MYIPPVFPPKKYYLLFIVLAFFIAGCAGSSKFSSEEDRKANYNASEIIKVLLAENPQKILFKAENKIFLMKGNDSAVLINPGNIVEVSFSNNNFVVRAGKKEYQSSSVTFKAAEETNKIKFKGKNYFGSFDLVYSGGTIKLVNSVSLETYMNGVLPYEMPSGKGREYYEALKAMAICSRTYAVRRISEKKADFDIYADTRDQVYGGADGWTKNTIDAVEETAGLIMSYNGQPAVTFYHSTCGGYTEDCGNVFQQKNVPYLAGIKDGEDPYCSISPKFNWEEQYTQQDITGFLYSAGLISSPDYTLNKMFVVSRFRSGRINELRIVVSDSTGIPSEVSIFGNNIRSVVKSKSGNILNSNNFDISTDSLGSVILKGKGYGHGVGLCQWGAINQSKQGRSYEDILTFYFPGTKVITYDDAI